MARNVAANLVEVKVNRLTAEYDSFCHSVLHKSCLLAVVLKTSRHRKVPLFYSFFRALT